MYLRACHAGGDLARRALRLTLAALQCPCVPTPCRGGGTDALARAPQPPAGRGRTQIARTSLLTLLLAFAYAATTAAQQNPDSARSTRSGVYTASQASKGNTLYAFNCVSCHTPASHAGPAFVAKWDGRTVSELFEYIRSSMPKSDPGSLTRKEYIQVLAYLLKMNGMPPGAVELPADSLALKKIRMDLKPVADPSQPSQHP